MESLRWLRRTGFGQTGLAGLATGYVLSGGLLSRHKAFPKDELFGMTSQIRRAASSVPANIAEGYGRDSKGEYIQFLRVAQGSLKELETHLTLSMRVGLMSESETKNVFEECDDLGRMLHRLIRSLQRSSPHGRLQNIGKHFQDLVAYGLLATYRSAHCRPAACRPAYLPRLPIAPRYPRRFEIRSLAERPSVRFPACAGRRVASQVRPR